MEFAVPTTIRLKLYATITAQEYGNTPIRLAEWEGNVVGGTFSESYKHTSQCNNTQVVLDEAARTWTLYPACLPGWCIEDSDCGSAEICDFASGSCAPAPPEGADDDIDSALTSQGR